jgi:uncharacterized membrane protein
MRKKVGWIWIVGAVLLFAVNFLTLGNQSLITGKLASTLSVIIGFVICPILIFIGISILILGKKEK